MANILNLRPNIYRNATPQPVNYSIRVIVDDPTVINILNTRHYLQAFGHPNIDNNEPCIEILQIRTRLREGVEYFLRECGHRIRRRRAYFDGSYSTFRPAANDPADANIPPSLFLNIPREEFNHFFTLQEDIGEIADSINWNMPNANPQLNNLVTRTGDFPKIRMCDFNDNNLGQLTRNISRAPNLPFNGSFVEITAVAAGQNFEMPVVSFQPPYNHEDGPHVNFAPGHGVPGYWP